MRKRGLNVIALSAILALGGVVGVTLSSCGSTDNETTKYSVNYTTSSDYTISIASGTQYEEGATVSFIVTAASGKVVESVTVNGSPLVATNGTYSFRMPKSNVTIAVTVEDEAVVTYNFNVTLNGSKYVGQTLTTSATINDTAFNDYTITATAGASLVTINAENKTITLNAAGEVTLTFTATYDGQTLTDTETFTITDTSAGYDVLFTIDPTTTTNLKSLITGNSTYKDEGTASDEINGVTVNYTEGKNLGISNPNYGGYGDIGTFQGRSNSKDDTFFATTNILTISKIEISYYGTYDTYDNFLDVKVGNTTIDTPTLVSTRGTGVDYTNQNDQTYEINEFIYEYYFEEEATGTLSISGSKYTSYFKDIKVYGEAGELPNPTAISLTASETSIPTYGRTTLTATTTPVSTSGTISYNIKSGDEFIDLDGNQVIGVKPGTAVVNATITFGDNQTLTSNDVTITVTESSIYDSATEVTVAELLDITPSADFSENNTDTTLYAVTGIAIDVQGDQYGNMYLADKETKESIQVYGCSTLGTAITFDGTTYNFDNSRTGNEVITNFDEGDEITLYALYGRFGSGFELLSEFGEVVTPKEEMTIYQIDSVLPEYVSASKSTALIYGEEVTLTVNADLLPEGKEISEIKHNGTRLSAETDGTYKFNAYITNEIEVTLKDEGAQITTFELTVADFPDLTSSYSNGTATIGGINFSYNALMKGVNNSIQNNVDAGSTKKNSAIYNTSALPYEIASIELVAASNWTSNNPTYEVSFGTSTIDANTNPVTLNKSSLTATCNVSGATYFRIERSGKSASYLDKIIIHYVA